MQRNRTSDLVVAALLEFSCINDSKSFCRLVESDNKIVKLGTGLLMPESLQSVDEAALVVEDVDVKLKLVRREVTSNTFGQLGCCNMTAFFAHGDKGW